MLSLNVDEGHTRRLFWRRGRGDWWRAVGRYCVHRHRAVHHAHDHRGRAAHSPYDRRGGPGGAANLWHHGHHGGDRNAPRTQARLRPARVQHPGLDRVARVDGCGGAPWHLAEAGGLPVRVADPVLFQTPEETHARPRAREFPPGRPHADRRGGAVRGRGRSNLCLSPAVARSPQAAVPFGLHLQSHDAVGDEDRAGDHLPSGGIHEGVSAADGGLAGAVSGRDPDPY